VHSNPLCDIARKPVSNGLIVLALVSVATQMIALAAVTGWSATPRSADVKQTMASALIHSVECAGAAATKPSSCPVAAAQPKLAGNESHERVEVPQGAKQCPESGPGVACTDRSALFDPGNSATPDGMPACPIDPSKPLTAPGSCAAAPASVTAAPAKPSTPPTETAIVSPAGGPSHSPITTSSPDALTLSTTSTSLTAGSPIFLDAQSTIDVTGTPYAIEIFDTATKALVAACTQTNECKVAFSAKGGHHSFVAYVVSPSTSLPASGARLISNKVDVRFLGVSLQVNNPSIVAPGKAVTFVATATEDVGKTGFVIELNDARTGQRLTFCRFGTSCSMSLVVPAAGTHAIIATLGPSTPEVRDANPDVHAASTVVTATWLSVSLDASAGVSGRGNAVTLSALANADLSQTPYSIYFFDQDGQQVGDPCNAQSCTATATIDGDQQAFTAVIGALPVAGVGKGPLSGVLHSLPTSRNRLFVQAASPAVKPVRTLWGVDSCKRITELLGQVNHYLGTPDFWARYLPNTGACGGLNGAEIAAAHNWHIGILPIFNDYDCSAVHGYATGTAYAQEAVQWMQNDLVPAGVAIAVDIEPVGDCAAYVDAAFINGWYDVIMQSRFLPAFYGDTAPGSSFANAWCAAVQQRPEIANNSYLWSFEPSLSGSFSKGNAPRFNPYSPGCAGHYVGWQYVLSAGGTPDVDQDELSSLFPLWYP